MSVSVSRILVLLTCVVLLTWGVAGAHFGMIIPSDEMVMKGENNKVSLQLMFWQNSLTFPRRLSQ